MICPKEIFCEKISFIYQIILGTKCIPMTHVGNLHLTFKTYFMPVGALVMLLLLFAINDVAGAYAQSVNQGAQISNTIEAVAVGSGEFGVTHGSGTIFSISAEIRDGQGRVWISIDETIQGTMWQAAAQRAAYIAAQVTEVDLSNRDAFFSVAPSPQYADQDLSNIDGPSAGAAMTVLLISQILQIPLNDQVLMTGTIRSDGRVGPVGGVVEKAETAGKHGADIFLVPVGAGMVGGMPLTDVVGSKYGMEIIEVYHIMDVLPYYFS
jgi:uncharacterized protein